MKDNKKTMRLPFLLPLWVFGNVHKILSRISNRHAESVLFATSGAIGVLWHVVRKVSGKSEKLEFEIKPNSASISVLAASWMVELLERLQPRSILEFGTGYSSLVFARYAEQKDGVTIISLEHDSHWYHKQLQILESLGVGAQVNLVLASVKLEQGEQGPEAVYDQSILGRYDNNFDMVFVDGPVGSKFGGPGRKGTIRQAIEKTKSGGLILLHDALREEEFSLIKAYTKNNKKVRSLGIFPDYDGLAVFEKY